MIRVELESQRSHPAEFARGMLLAIRGDDSVRAIAAMRNLAEILMLHANSLTDSKWSR